MPVLLLLALFSAVFGIDLWLPNTGVQYVDRGQAQSNAVALNFATYQAAVETFFAYTSSSGSTLGTTLSPSTPGVRAFLPASYTALGTYSTSVSAAPSNGASHVLLVSSISPTNLPVQVFPTAVAQSLALQEVGLPGVGIIHGGILTTPSVPNAHQVSLTGISSQLSMPPNMANTTVSTAELTGLADNTVVIVHEVVPGTQVAAEFAPKP